MTETDQAGPSRMDVTDKTFGVLREVYAERKRQDALVKEDKFPWNCAHPKPHWSEKLAVLAEEFGEVGREVTEYLITRDKYLEDKELGSIPDHRVKYYRDRLRKELIQVAAVCVAWAESLGGSS